MKALNLANSSTVHARKESDYYPTPPEVTQALLNTGLIPKQRLWEPACGEGHMSEVLKKHSSSVLSTDLRATGYTGGCLPLDFLSGKSCYPQGFIEGIVTNPPFNLSTEFLETAMSHKPKVIALLLKSQYWHSQKRAALFEKYPPAYVMALTWRPDFCFGDRGGAPTMECIWTVWIEGETDTRYRILRKPSHIPMKNRSEQYQASGLAMESLFAEETMDV